MRNEAKMESISMDSAENNPARVQYTMQGTEVPKGCFMSVTDPQPTTPRFFFKRNIGKLCDFFFLRKFSPLFLGRTGLLCNLQLSQEVDDFFFYLNVRYIFPV